MKHVARVKSISCNRACRVDRLGVGALVSARSPAGSVKRGDGTVGSAQVAVEHVAGVNQETGNCPRRVDAADGGALARACACARGRERGDGTVASTHEAVIHTAQVNILSRDFACRVDGIASGTYRARNIERDEGRLPLVSMRGKAQP